MTRPYTFYKFKDGKNVIRILPSVEECAPAIYKVRMHTLYNSVTKKFTSHPCLYSRETKALCASCMNYFKASEALESVKGVKADLSNPVQVLLGAKAKFKAFAFGIDRDAEDEGLKLITLPYAIEKALDLFKDEGINPFDLEKGMDLVIKKSGSGQFGTEYNLSPALKESPLSNDPEKAEKWLAARIPLAETNKVRTNEEMISSLYYTAGDVLFDLIDLENKLKNPYRPGIKKSRAASQEGASSRSSTTASDPFADALEMSGDIPNYDDIPF